jgi:hypothetical protein
VRQVSRRLTEGDVEVTAEVDMESTQEFEIRSDIASNCTGTWWNEDPKFTRHQVRLFESKFFVKTGQNITLRKVFMFRKSGSGWRCDVQSIKPVEDVFFTSR